MPRVVKTRVQIRDVPAVTRDVPGRKTPPHLLGCLSALSTRRDATARFPARSSPLALPSPVSHVVVPSRRAAFSLTPRWTTRARTTRRTTTRGLRDRLTLDDGKGRYESWEDFWRRTSALNAKKAREAGGDPNSEPSAATPAPRAPRPPARPRRPRGPHPMLRVRRPVLDQVGVLPVPRDLQAPLRGRPVRHVGARVLVRRGVLPRQVRRAREAAQPLRRAPTRLDGEATRSSPRRATARSGTRRDSRERPSRTARRCSENRRGETGGTAARGVDPLPRDVRKRAGRRASSPVPVRPEKTSSSDDASSRRRRK